MIDYCEVCNKPVIGELAYGKVLCHEHADEYLAQLEYDEKVLGLEQFYAYETARDCEG